MKERQYAVMVFVDGKSRVTATAFENGCEPVQIATLVIPGTSLAEAEMKGIAKVRADLGGSAQMESKSRIIVP
jgi:pyruvate-formate lyase-activating enzyme